MENHPDSAYSLLQTIDSEALRTRGGRARYALLYTQAQDKNYIDHSNDSLITIAADYYREHGDEHTRFLSLYYKGRIHYNAGDYLNAMLNYFEAETLVPDLQDDYYAGLLYSQIGSIYRKFYDFPKSLEAYQKAEEYYKDANKDYHKLYAMTDQSTIYRNMDKYDKSDSLLQIVLLEAEYINKHSLIDYVLGSLIMQYVEQGYMKNAKSIYERMLKDYGLENNTSYFLTSVIKIHLYDGEYQDAERMLHKAWAQAKTANDSVACYFASSQIYKERRLFDKALQEHESGILIQNRIVKQNLQQPVLTIQRDYLSKELAFLKYRRIVEKTILIIIICVIISITLTVAIKYRKKMQRHNESIRYYVNELTGMKIVMENEKTEKSIQMQELFKEQFKVVGMLGESFIQSADEKNHQKKVYNEVKLLLETYGNDNKFYLQLENIVNRYNDNIIQLLREEIELPESTYHQFCYQIAGFSINVVSLFMKEKPATLYKRRSRVLEKIKVSDTLYKEIFIKYLLK